MLSFLKKLDKPADYIGQSFSYKLMYFILILGDSIALLAGFAYHNLVYTLKIGVVTACIAFIFTVPSWPYFRRHPLKFKQSALKEKSD